MSDLTPEDQEKLFQQVSNAIKDDDSTKLSELLVADAPIEDEQPVEETPADDTTEEVEEATEEAKPDEDDDKDDTSPQDDTPADDKKEPTEQEKTIAELRAQLEAANKDTHALRSQVGRIPEIQRKIARIDKKLETLNASPSSQASTKVKPEVDALLEAVKETDPVLADTIAKAMAKTADVVDSDAREQQKNDLLEERDQLLADHQQEQIARLTSMYPNAAEVFASPHWTAWKKQQPSHILGLAESDSADAVAFAFKLYADDMKKQYPELDKKTEEKPDGKETPDPEAAEKARQIEEERNRRKKAQPDLSTSKTGKRVQEPTDPNALFEYFSKQIREGK